MKKIETYGRIENGVEVPYREDVWKQQIQDIGFASHYKKTIEYGNKRTNRQNDYLFGGVITPITVRYNQDGWPYTPAYVYREFEGAFSKEQVHNEVTGETKTVVVPLKDQDTETFHEITMKIRDWAHKNISHLYIQLPHEYYKMTEEAYNSWRDGVITKKEAIKQSHKMLTG